MLKRNIIFTLCIISMAITSHTFASNVKLRAQTPVTQVAQTITNEDEKTYREVNALNLVAQPQKYLDKRVKIKGKFDKFCAIGLDYPPVNRPAKSYVSFLIKRDNVQNYNIPLSELKLIVKRDYAEKALINIEQNDEIEISGIVFSNALGDPWIDVESVNILTKKDTKQTESEGK